MSAKRPISDRFHRNFSMISVLQIKKTYFLDSFFLCLSFLTHTIQSSAAKVSSFCVYYSNPLIATICLQSANVQNEGGEIWGETEFPATFSEGSDGACDAWWLLFKNSSQANFHPYKSIPKGWKENLHCKLLN